jgi:site-specific DNA recombinase
MAMRLIGYARVSSREQSENSHALEQQIDRLKSEGCEMIYSDVESGYKGKNYPGLNQVLDLVRSKSVGEVVCTRVDRLSRRGVVSFAIFDDFIKADVILRVLDEPTDLSTASGKMVAGVLAVMAQHHSDSKAEAVKHGWRHLRSRKVAMNPPLGYVKRDDRYHLDHTPFVSLVEGQVELSKFEFGRELVAAFLDKKSLRLALRVVNQKFGIASFAHNNEPGKAKGGRVARGTLHFSPSGLSSWLTNPVLQGHTPYLRNGNGSHAQIHYDTHPDQRLISDDEVKTIGDILKLNKQVRGFGSTALKYPLSGLVFCGECRGSCYSVSGANNYHKAKRLGIAPDMVHYFQCKNWRTRSCTQRTMIKMDLAEESVIRALVDRASEIADYADRPLDIVEPPVLMKLREELSLYKSMPGSRASIIINELQLEIETQRRLLENQSNVYTDNRSLLLTTFSNSLFWETVEPDKKRQIYRDLVARVVVKDGLVIEVKLKV